MAERRNSLASGRISDYAEGVELIKKALRIMAKFSPNSIVNVPNHDKDECSCPICLGYYRDKDECSCPICLNNYRGKGGCRCSICLKYYRGKGGCRCSICLKYYRGKGGCPCSICLRYHRDKNDRRCSTCLQYYFGTDKAFSPTDATSKGAATSNSSNSFISVSEPRDDNHVESQLIPKYVLPFQIT